MKKNISAAILFLIILAWSQTISPQETVQQSGTDLPTLVYLGEGAATYTIDPGWDFIVKRSNPFDLVFVPGPTYTANDTDRVWRSQGTGGAPPAAFHNDIVVGNVTAGCLVRYAAIDDDIDGRFNSFYLNGILIHTIPEGMVTTGQFVIPQDGELSYDANDSIGMYLDVCSTTVTNTPDPNATETPTSNPTETPTSTPSGGDTPTPTSTTTINPNATATPTLDPLATSTSTADPSTTLTPSANSTPTVDATTDGTPAATGTVIPITPVVSSPMPGASHTPRPTKRPPREKSCLRINFEVGGDEAKNGRFDVVEVGGRILASWQAQDGWQDSGWMRNIELTHRAVHVQVLYYANDTAPPVTMRILNPAPDTEYGWLAEGVCHAIEVAWP